MKLFLIKRKLLRKRISLNREEKRNNGSKRYCYKQIKKNRKLKILSRSLVDQAVRKMLEK